MKKVMQIFKKSLGISLLIPLGLGLIQCKKKPTDAVIPVKTNTKPNLGSKDSLVDLDGNIYKTITIGDQTWMAENLKTTKYDDGTPITLVTDQTVWAGNWDNISSIPMMCYYNNDTSSASTYGALYNGFAVKTGNLCPLGWHVPDKTEWITFLNHWEDSVAFKLRSITELDSAGNIKKKVNFDAHQGGFRVANGTFQQLDIVSFWWTTTATNPDKGRSHSLGLEYMADEIGFYSPNDGKGLSVRCLRY